MTKKEILEKSRQDNKNADVYDLQIQKKAAFISYNAGIILASLVFILDLILTGKPVPEVMMISMGMMFIVFLYKYVKLHKRHELFPLICYGIGFVGFATVWIMQFLGL